MRTIALTLALVAAAGTLASCNKPKKAEPAPTPVAAPAPAPLTYESTARISVTAKVKAVDQATRRVTLEDSSGHMESFIAGPQVRRLNEVRVGDDVNAEYTVSLVGELRPATADEMASPIAAVYVSGRSSMGSEPAAGAAQGVRIVTTVAAVDLPSMMVTLQGPMGERAKVRAKKTENIKKLHVGDTIVITYVEAVAVALDKK